MTFTGKLRLTLILAAVLPMLLITVIVVLSVSQQVKRIENREARTACDRYDDLLESTIAGIAKSLTGVADSRDFEIMEMGLRSGRRVPPQYRLPRHSLDFLEYFDSSDIVLISANRPALVGRLYPGLSEPADRSDETILNRFRYENDLRGSHPALVLIKATETGFLCGGLYLDGQFKTLTEAVTRSKISFEDLRGETGKDLQDFEIGRPYRTDLGLLARLRTNATAEYYPRALFESSNQESLFSDFLTAVGAVLVFSLMVVIPAGLYFSSQTRRRIAGLTDGAARVASGDFTQPVLESGEGEFGELADSFNHMMKQLTESRERLIVSQKIAAWQTIGRKVAHEVKNPLTPISIAADDLKRSFAEGRSDFGQILNDGTDTIRNEVNRLKKLIDQFSAFARMPAPEIMKVNPDSFAGEIAVLFKEEISGGQVVIVNELGAKTVSIDPDQLLQVLINLIKNSLQADCGICTVILRRGDRDGLSIIVEDDGPGFPQKIIEEGITPYFSTKKDGSGLGLLISQRIIFDHDGTMIWKNIEDGGARVEITVPQTDA